MEPTESQRLLAHEFCRNWIASGHAVERMAVLLAEEHARGRAVGLEEAAKLLEHQFSKSPGINRDRAAALIREIK